MNEKSRLPDKLNLTRLRFYETDFKALDYSLTEKEQAEWNAIYASYRSSSILSGEIIGVEGVPLPDGEDRCTRLRPAPGRGHCEAAWRLGEIQQRGRRVHVGIPRPRRVLNAIRAPLEAVGARSLFFGALCATVEAEGGDMP